MSHRAFNNTTTHDRIVSITQSVSLIELHTTTHVQIIYVGHVYVPPSTQAKNRYNRHTRKCVRHDLRGRKLCLCCSLVQMHTCKLDIQHHTTTSTNNTHHTFNQQHTINQHHTPHLKPTTHTTPSTINTHYTIKHRCTLSLALYAPALENPRSHNCTTTLFLHSTALSRIPFLV